MNNYHQQKKSHSDHIQYKSSASYLYQKFLSIDKKMRLNIIIGGSMIAIVLVTGLILAMISLFQFGGNLLNEALGDTEEHVIQLLPAGHKKDVANVIHHVVR